MSRTDNFVGISPRADAWLDSGPKGPMVGKTYIHLEGAYGNKFALLEYVDSDDVKVREVIQAERCDSGPWFFTTLRRVTAYGLEPIPGLDWMEEEIDERLK